MLFLIYSRYRPGVREPQSGSAHAVMDIGLVSGLEANTEDLSTVSIREFFSLTEVFLTEL